MFLTARRRTQITNEKQRGQNIDAFEEDKLNDSVFRCNVAPPLITDVNRRRLLYESAR